MQIKENIKTPCHWPLWGIQQWPVDSPHKGPVMQKMFHLMMSTWYMSQQNELSVVQQMVGCFIGEVINLTNNNKWSRHWWFEMPLRSLWHYCNEKSLIILVLEPEYISGSKPWLLIPWFLTHYDDVIMSMMASQITSFSIVYSTICSGPDERKHQSSASLAFIRGIHQWPVNSTRIGPVT